MPDRDRNPNRNPMEHIITLYLIIIIFFVMSVTIFHEPIFEWFTMGIKRRIKWCVRSSLWTVHTYVLHCSRNFLRRRRPSRCIYGTGPGRSGTSRRSTVDKMNSGPSEDNPWTTCIHHFCSAGSFRCCCNKRSRTPPRTNRSRRHAPSGSRDNVSTPILLSHINKIIIEIWNNNANFNALLLDQFLFLQF